MKKTKVPLILTILLSLGLVLSGCGDADEPATDDTTSSQSEEATSEEPSSSSLPADFPSEVPLIEGTIREAAKLEDGNTKWLVEIAVPDILPTFERGVALLEEAGFTEVYSMPDSEASVGSWENDAFSVTFETSLTNNLPGASYVVMAKCGIP